MEPGRLQTPTAAATALTAQGAVLQIANSISTLSNHLLIEMYKLCIHPFRAIRWHLVFEYFAIFCKLSTDLDFEGTFFREQHNS